VGEGGEVFELVERDGLARIGRFETPHGVVETPILLPVVHADPDHQGISPSEMREKWGVEAIITSSYILHENAELKDKARHEGLHRLLDFHGTIMTDSGAFQQHVYGDVAVTPEEIILYQNEIGTDIATVLDRFIEPGASRQDAEQGVEETLLRAMEARDKRGQRLLAVPIQGGLYKELRERSALGSSALGDVLCVGGIVPLFETYRFADITRVMTNLRPSLPPEKPVHLFGMGHPMVFALGALLGGDIFDTSSYHKFAKRGALLFPEGSVDLESVREDVCGCKLCAQTPLTKVKELPRGERELHLARHNLNQCLLEMKRVRQAIRDGELWELAERRSTSHPALLAALREATASPDAFLPYEPPSRKSFLILSELSQHRPAVVRFQRNLAKYVSGRGPGIPVAGQRLTSRQLSRAPPEIRQDPADPTLWMTTTPLGPVPLELTEVYPLGCLVGPDEFAAFNTEMPQVPEAEEDEEDSPDEDKEEESTSTQAKSSSDAPDSQTAERWATRHALGIVEWCWGRAARTALSGKQFNLRHSRASGRLREIILDGAVLFVIGNDGLPMPTFLGAKFLHGILPFPSMRVIANEDAAPFVSSGRSLFSRHVISADKAVGPGQHVLVVDINDGLLGVGRTLMAAQEMGRFTRGMAVRVTAHRPGD
jgi:7-cyano-7-deazaguanine tRNA-ribosyltransferase